MVKVKFIERCHYITIIIRNCPITLFYFNLLPSPVTYCLPQVLSMYLSCSGYTEVTNSCLDRVVCEYANENNKISQEEKDVISM